MRSLNTFTKMHAVPLARDQSGVGNMLETVGMSLAGFSTFGRAAFASRRLLNKICLSVFERAPFASHVEDDVGGKELLTQARTMTNSDPRVSCLLSRPMKRW